MKHPLLLAIILAFGLIPMSYADRDPSSRGWGAVQKGFEKGMEYGLRTQEIENQRIVSEAELENQRRAMEAEDKIRELEYSIKMQQLENEKLKEILLKKSLKDKSPSSEN